jgi:hypothetical protein
MNAEIAPMFASADAAVAAGIADSKQLDSWLSRGAFRLAANDIDAMGHGYHRKWSVRSIRKLALMVTLSQLGVAPARAYAAADECLARCEYFDDTLRTFASFDCSRVVKVFTIDGDRKFEDSMDGLFAGSEGAIIVDLTRLFSHVDDRLHAVATFIEDSK